jgi:hypothetical protein
MHKGEYRYSSTYSQRRWQIESGERHVPADLSQEINPITIEVETVWVSEPVWAVLKVRRLLPTTIRDPVHPELKIRR